MLNGMPAYRHDWIAGVTPGNLSEMTDLDRAPAALARGAVAGRWRPAENESRSKGWCACNQGKSPSGGR
jgi:hypothetical protein